VYYYIEKDIFITVNWAGRRLFRTNFFTCLKAIFLLQQTGRGLLRPKFLYRYKNDIFIYSFHYRIKVFAQFFLISIISLLLIQSKTRTFSNQVHRSKRVSVDRMEEVMGIP